MRLPMDVCSQHKLSQPSLLRGEVTPELQDTVHTIASAAVLQLNTGTDILAGHRPDDVLNGWVWL